MGVARKWIFNCLANDNIYTLIFNVITKCKETMHYEFMDGILQFCWCRCSVIIPILNSYLHQKIFFLISFSSKNLCLFPLSVLTVIHFHAPWSPQCTQMNDVMSELAKDNSHVKFYKVSELGILNFWYEKNFFVQEMKVIFYPCSNFAAWSRKFTWSITQIWNKCSPHIPSFQGNCDNFRLFVQA